MDKMESEKVCTNLDHRKKKFKNSKSHQRFIFYCPFCPRLPYLKKCILIKHSLTENQSYGQRGQKWGDNFSTVHFFVHKPKCALFLLSKDGQKWGDNWTIVHNFIHLFYTSSPHTLLPYHPSFLLAITFLQSIVCAK